MRAKITVRSGHWNSTMSHGFGPCAIREMDPGWLRLCSRSVLASLSDLAFYNVIPPWSNDGHQHAARTEPQLTPDSSATLFFVQAYS